MARIHITISGATRRPFSSCFLRIFPCTPITVGTVLLKREPGRMTHYANDTGGDAFFASKQADIERLYSAIDEQARNQYTLAYAPQNPGTGDYHTIEVRIERPGLRVSAREGYYASAAKH